MGFAPVASSAIILIAFFHIIGSSVPSALDAKEAVQQAQEDAWEREATKSALTAIIDDGTTNATHTTIEATNTGEVPIRLNDVVFVLDGAPISPSTWTVNGATTNLWLPGETVTITANQGGATFIALGLSDGELLHWRP